MPAASVVGEAMVALELTRAFREKFGGDALDHVVDAVEAYRRRLREV